MDYLVMVYVGGFLATMPFHWQLQRHNNLMYRVINTLICSAIWPLLQAPKIGHS